MVEIHFQELQKGTEPRTHLAALRDEWDDSQPPELVIRYLDLICGFLKDPDPKVRKNTAGLLGKMAQQVALKDRDRVAGMLWNAYQTDEILFVKPSYLKALAEYPHSQFEEELRQEEDRLIRHQPSVEEEKVYGQLRRAMHQVLGQGCDWHTFHTPKTELPVALTVRPELREQLLGEFAAAKPMPLGIQTMLSDFSLLKKIRYYQKLLFPVLASKKCPFTRETFGQALAASELTLLLQKLLPGDPHYSYHFKPYGQLAEEKDLLPKLVLQVEKADMGLINFPRHQAELLFHLLPLKDGRIAVYMEIASMEDPRFAYFGQPLSTGMSPVAAAELMQLCRPYLKKNLQILDPCCGIGTLIIERHFALATRERYGIDTYKDAVDTARINTQKAGISVNYIHRDYLDFTHEYAFDEILCEMPFFTRERSESKAGFYREFFKKSLEISAEDFTWILVTDQENLISENLRRNHLHLVDSIPFSSRRKIYIIRRA